jgi:putative (di)nucleoside polyphosphate hydrolase
MQERYRPNVAALLVDRDGRLLVCERRDFKNSWQFPQGGVDRGESAAQALERELAEELGLQPHHYRVLRQESGYRYFFPQNSKAFRRFVGQEQTYFLCKMLGTDNDIRLDTHKPEFVAWRWIQPEEFDFEWLPEFKHPVYRRVLRDFFNVGEEA